MTDDQGASVCDELFREYIDWLDERLRLDHGVRISKAGTDAAHAAFRAEWPTILEPRGRMYLLLVDDAPAGVGTLKPISADEAELKRTYITPDHRGRGLARRLSEQIIGDARLLGYRALRLETFDFMTSAHSLYRSLGFVDAPQFEGIEGAGFEAFELFMRLDLTTP